MNKQMLDIPGPATYNAITPTIEHALSKNNSPNKGSGAIINPITVVQAVS